MRRPALLAVTASLLILLAPTARAAITSPESTADGLRGETRDRAITFIGTWRDRPDLAELHLGADGSWFPQFAALAPTAGAGTGENARDDLPSWVAALNHTTGPEDPGCSEPNAVERGCTPSYYFRTFSQDGPDRSAGGIAAWSRLRLPSGECGVAGAIVDPHTYVAGQPNSNNTVNRVQLQDGVPSTFFVSIVTDATAHDNDAARVELRGSVGMLDVPSDVADNQVEASYPTEMDATADGVPDVHVFRVDDFSSGDYLKIRLRGATSAASFSGLLFDEAIDPPPQHGRHGVRPSSMRCGS